MTQANSKAPLVLSSERMDWRTPEWFLELVRQVSPDRQIHLDPCSAPGNPTRALRHIIQTPEHCGLRDPWPENGMVFVNPPYGPHLSGDVDPLVELKRKGKVVGIGRGWARRITQRHGLTIALLPTRTSAEWWHELFDWAHFALLWRSPERGARISFVDPTTGEPVSGSTVESTVFFRASVYRALDCARFARVFEDHGRLLAGGGGEEL